MVQDGNAASPKAAALRKRVDVVSLLRDAVDRLLGVVGGALDLDSHLLAHRAADESAHRMRLPVGGGHDLGHGRAGLAAQQVEDDGLLAEFARYGVGAGLLRGRLGCLCGLLGLGRGLPGGCLPGRGGLLRRNGGARWRNADSLFLVAVWGVVGAPKRRRQHIPDVCGKGP